MRESEDDVEIVYGQNFRLTSLTPASRVEALAFWAMPIAAGVVGWSFEVAVVAALKMAAERGRAAALDGAHDFELRHRQGMGAAEGLAMEAQDIRHFPPGSWRTRQPCRPMGMDRRHGSVLLQPLGIGDRQQVQRALSGPELLARDLQIPHGGEDGRVTHEDLDGARIDPGLQHMRGEGVAK